MGFEHETIGQARGPGLNFVGFQKKAAIPVKKKARGTGLNSVGS